MNKMKYKTIKNKPEEKTLFEKIWGGILTALCSLEAIGSVVIICLLAFFEDSDHEELINVFSNIARSLGIFTLIFIEIHIVAKFYVLKLEKNRNIPFIISIIMILTTFICFVLSLINMFLPFM